MTVSKTFRCDLCDEIIITLSSGITMVIETEDTAIAVYHGIHDYTGECENGCNDDRDLVQKHICQNCAMKISNPISPPSEEKSEILEKTKEEDGDE